MKTIAQIANELNMSRQNVYLCVKQAGIDLDTLNKTKQGKQVLFSDEAVNQIVSACLESRNRHVKKENVSHDSFTKIQTLQDKIDRLTEELSRTQEQLTAAQQEIARLRAIEDEQRHTISSQAEAMRLRMQQDTLRIEAEQPKRQRIGFIRRISSMLEGKKDV